MARIQGYKDLLAWQKAMDLVVEVYRLSRAFPADERFGLTAQVRSAVVSIPSNIAEGHGRSTKADFIRFLDIALGSANEVETQLLAAIRLAFIENGELTRGMDLVHEVQALVKGLIGSLRRSSKTNIRPQQDG